MNYKETLEYIQSLNQYGSVLGLDNMHRLCGKLGHPEERCRFIHIAGTNGKGSTSAYIAHILMAAGFKVGRYVSPTISDYRERFQIGTRMITQKDLCAYVERVKDVCEELVAEGYPHPTPFEVETVLGFLYFAEKACDYVVLEVGMGGATDATNVIPAPVACVWTSISRDHMGFLGKTLSEIAGVKAGIAKRGALFISCKQVPEVMQVLLEQVKQLSSESFLHIADVAQATGVKYGLTTQQFSYKGLSKLKIHLAGTHQIANAVLAVEIILQLRKSGIDISDKAIYKGLEETSWPGRLEVLGKKPLFILDGAHNEDAAKQLASSIETYFLGKRLIYIMGVLKDKEYDRILSLTAKYAEHILTITPPDNPRALSAFELAAAAGAYHPQVTNLSSLEEAVEVSHLLADKDTVILCFGSLSYLGAIKKVYAKFSGAKRP
ncbi:MAG: bifunctional folylpolyglutamate synthase/dihydrofolate synthase [Lachnospiraceae bacterium]|nr:bifunctional folylpolyglutamate synthase/dihydrofolate synthase [Lachnospiraceae bacterium]